MSTKSQERFAHSLILGRSEAPKDPTGGWDIRAPYDLDLKLARAQFAYPQIDEALSLTKRAQQSWADQGITQRKAVLVAAFQKVVQGKEPLLNEVMLETGRPPHDLALEWTQIEKWFSLFQSEAFSELDPRGTVAVIGSNVWPLYYAIHFSFLSLLMGNSVVLKPSEKTTLSVLTLASLLVKEPLLAPVLQVLVGEKEFSRRLACHDQINAVIFMGSYEVGIRIRQDTLHQTQKEVLLFLGAKNASIVCEDAPEMAMETLIQDSLLMAGQHCRSISQIFIHESRYREWVDRFHQKAKEFKIGAPESGAWMGPLMDDSMVDRYLKFCGISEREGATVEMRGKVLSQGKRANLITPTLVTFENLTPDQLKKSVSLQTEILSPHVSLIRFKSYEEVIRLLQHSHYGLCASVWSAQAERALELANELEVGQILINQSTLSMFPEQSFQAKKKSGNHAFQGFDLTHQLGLKKQIHFA